MPPEPPVKKAIAFIDGQNLFHAAKEAFGYRWPNFDPLKLATELCRPQGWTLAEVRFYTGVPDRSDEPFWNHFWTAKLAKMGREGSERGRRRAQNDCARAGSVAQDRVRVPVEPNLPQCSRRQQDRLDPHRPRHLRRMSRPSRLSAKGGAVSVLVPGVD